MKQSVRNKTTIRVNSLILRNLTLYTVGFLTLCCCILFIKKCKIQVRKCIFMDVTLHIKLRRLSLYMNEQNQLRSVCLEVILQN